MLNLLTHFTLALTLGSGLIAGAPTLALRQEGNATQDVYTAPIPENVVQELHALYPDMKIFNGFVDRTLGRTKAGGTYKYNSTSADSGKAGTVFAKRRELDGIHGVNFGMWFVQEVKHNPAFFQNSPAPNTTDEWTLCQTIGKTRCAEYLNKQYSNFYTTEDVDRAAAYGINTLRIPTTYQAWIDMPGSWLVHGDQKKYLGPIVDYAISKYNMNVIINLHGLPGGINGIDIGEAFGHNKWWLNATNMDYSIKTVDAALKWIVKRPGYHQGKLHFQPMNEGYQLPQLGPKLATTDGLYDSGANWIGTFYKAVMELKRKWAPKMTVYLQDNFMGSGFWIPYLTDYEADEIVMDVHLYFFNNNVSAWDVVKTVCQQRFEMPNPKFKTVVGEFSTQSGNYNQFANRRMLLETQRDAFSGNRTYGMAGSLFWSMKSFNDQLKMLGEGTKEDYFSYEALMDAGVLTKGRRQYLNESACSGI